MLSPALLVIVSMAAEPTPRLTFGASGSRPATLTATCEGVGPSVNWVTPSTWFHRDDVVPRVTVYLLHVPRCSDVPTSVPCYSANPSYPAFLQCRYTSTEGTASTGPYHINIARYEEGFVDYSVTCDTPPASEIVRIVGHGSYAMRYNVSVGLQHAQTGVSLEYEGLEGGNVVMVDMAGPPAPPSSPGPLPPPLPPLMPPPPAPPAKASLYLQYQDTIVGFGAFRAQHKCYQSSSNAEYSTQNFRQSCQSYSRTITIMKFDNGYIVGAYSGIPWKYDDHGYRTDSSAFIFSITTNHKYGLMSNMAHHSHVDQTNYGPCLGGGHDLCIKGQGEGYCNLGHTFYCRVGNRGSTTCQNDLCGTYQGWKLVELEVWR